MAAELSLSAIGSERLAELRRKHPRLVYNSFEGRLNQRGGIRLRFDFLLEPDITFAPETIFESVNVAGVGRTHLAFQENLYFHLGMIESLSYWKAACPPGIIIETPEDVPVCALNEAQIGWWLDLLRRGMGEFFYVN